MPENPPKKTRGKQKRAKSERSELIAQYALERAKGTTKKEAAEKLGISRRQVYHVENSAPDLLKELIVEAGEQLARQGLQGAVNVITDTIEETMTQGVTGIYWREQPALDDEGQPTGETELKPRYDSDLHKAQLGLRKLGIQASEQVLKATGILNTPATAPVIHNLTVQQTNLLLPAVRNVLTALSMSALVPNNEAEESITDTTDR